MSSVVHRSLRVPIGAALALALVVAIAIPGTAQAEDKRPLSVMTQNIYLGSSLDPALGATTPEEFLIAVATIFATVQLTDFPTRSEAIADSIAASTPDVIGLQEVSKWTTTGPAPAGFDFLAILQQDLVDRGLSYSVAAVSDNASIGPVPLVLCADPTIGACTVTLDDRDVILVNEDNTDLVVTNADSGRYTAQASIPTPVGAISFDRGWALIDGTLDGKNFRVANTHLETGAFPSKQEAQGREFLAGPAKTGGAVIATGDFNSRADGSSTTTYGDLTKSYFRDAWDTNPGDPGLTCCQNGTLTNPASQLNSRIDLVLTHAASRTLDATVVNDAPFQSVPPFWPSDHAGVVATVRIH